MRVSPRRANGGCWSCHSLIVVGHCRKYQIPVFARVRAVVGYLRGLPLVPFEVAANAPGRGLLDVDHCAGLASGAVMQCHIAVDASGKQGSRKMMFGVAAVGYDDLAIEYHVIGIPVSVVWLLLRMQISFQHSSSQRKEPVSLSPGPKSKSSSTFEAPSRERGFQT